MAAYLVSIETDSHRRKREKLFFCHKRVINKFRSDVSKFMQTHVAEIATKLPIYRSIIERFTGRFIAIYRRFLDEISLIISPEIVRTTRFLIEEFFTVRNV